MYDSKSARNLFMSRRKRVGIDATSLYSRNRRGIGKSLWELYSRIVDCAPEWDFYFYFEKGLEDCSPWTNIPKNVFPRPLSMRGDRYQLWRNVRLPLALIMDRIDLLHCPAQITPFLKVTPTILTVHDVIPLVIEDGWSEAMIAAFTRRIKYSLERADHIIAISEYTKGDVMDKLGDYAKGPVSVVHWGAPVIREVKHTASETAIESTPDSFFALGGDSPRKNTRNLLMGFIQFLSVQPDSNLVVSGLHRKSLLEYGRLISGYPECRDRIKLLGYISDQELVEYMHSASAFVFPSLYEGFGLPILEAMSLGTPVIAGRNSAIVEVAANSSLYIEGETSDNISCALISFSKMPLEERKRFSDLARERAKKFEWARTAEMTLGIFAKYL